MTIQNPYEIIVNELAELRAATEQIKAMLTRQTAQPEQQPDRYLSAEQAAELTGYTIGTLYQKHRKRQIPGFLRL